MFRSLLSGTRSDVAGVGKIYGDSEDSMSEHTKRTLSDWAMVGTIILTIIGYEISVNVRLARLEQKVDDLISMAKGAVSSAR